MSSQPALFGFGPMTLVSDREGGIRYWPRSALISGSSRPMAPRSTVRFHADSRAKRHACRWRLHADQKSIQWSAEDPASNRHIKSVTSLRTRRSSDASGASNAGSWDSMGIRMRQASSLDIGNDSAGSSARYAQGRRPSRTDRKNGKTPTTLRVADLTAAPPRSEVCEKRVFLSASVRGNLKCSGGS